LQITIITHSGRGDVEPFIALALRLMADGHSAKIVTRPDFEELLTQYGVEFVPLGRPYQPFIAAAAESQAIGTGHFLNKIRVGVKQRAYIREGLHDDAWQASQSADVIVYKWPWIVPYSIAEKLDVPCVPVMLLPLTPTRAFPSFMMGRGIDRGAVVNSLLWQVPLWTVWQGLRLDDRTFRRGLGMPALPHRRPLPKESDGMPMLCEWSPSVLPAPRDWPANHRVTGYWFLDPPQGWRPPDGLVDFLEAGERPVSIGFGSMISGDRSATLRTILAALDIAGLRAVVLGGWSEIGAGASLPECVFAAPDIPHSWLLPRVAAVVHHGGAGTTGAALRAGIPQVICPFLGDQPSWARVVQSLGAGPLPLPFAQLDARQLAAALREAVTDSAQRQRADAIGEQVRSEHGVERAASLIADYVQRG
jgi:sterol 3beta-glucosyltransferase